MGCDAPGASDEDTINARLRRGWYGILTTRAVVGAASSRAAKNCSLPRLPQGPPRLRHARVKRGEGGTRGVGERAEPVVDEVDAAEQRAIAFGGDEEVDGGMDRARRHVAQHGMGSAGPGMPGSAA